MTQVITTTPITQSLQPFFKAMSYDENNPTTVQKITVINDFKLYKEMTGQEKHYTVVATNTYIFIQEKKPTAPLFITSIKNNKKVPTTEDLKSIFEKLLKQAATQKRHYLSVADQNI